MPNRIVADLHLHTTTSDGELELPALIEKAAAARLQAIAITDHDALADMQTALACGRRHGINVIAGCEVTAYCDETELHILALFVDSDSTSALGQLLAQIKDSRPQRLLEMAAKLRTSNIPITDQEVLASAKGSSSPGRMHVARALLNRKLVRSLDEAFKLFRGPGSVAYVPKPKFSAAEVIAAIHESRGLAILAHPGKYQNDSLIAPLFKMGLDGLEAIHPAHSAMTAQTYASVALSEGKCISGGSDFHGPRTTPNSTLGLFGLDASKLAELIDRAGKFSAR